MSTGEVVTEQSPLAAFLQWYRDEPDAVAVECLAEPHTKVTVREVYARAVYLAETLLKVEGSQQDGVVGIQIELEPELYIAFFACWMAGRTPTVMNVTWNAETYAAVVSRLNIRTIVHTRLTPPQLPDVYAVDATSLGSSDDLPSSKFAPEPFYALINQSSGTTGPPKSVPVRTAMYSHFCPRVTPTMSHRLRAAFVTAPSFSGVTAGIYLAPYIKGVCVYPGPASNGPQGYSAAEIATNIKLVLDHGVDSVGFTASLFTLFDSTLQLGHTFPNLQWATFGGELTPPHVIRTARARFPNATITVGFSSTESVQAGFGTAYPPSFDVSSLTEVVVHPNQNVEKLLLLDSVGQVVPLKAGVSGRVAVVTAASADPYLVSPVGKRTAQDEKDLASTRDTFRKADDGRVMIVYGDRAIYRPGPDEKHGIVVLGREGRRIKRNGVFVDLGALDTLALRAFSEILEDMSILASGRVLVGLVVTRDGSSESPSLEDLNQALARETDVQLGLVISIPRTPIAVSGKKDWIQLQAIADGAAQVELEHLPAIDPNDLLSHQIARSIAEVLDEPRLMTRDARLARVGVDSIGAARLLNMIRKMEGGERLRGEDLLDDNITVSSLAARMRGDHVHEHQMSKAYLDAEVKRLTPEVRQLQGGAQDTPPKNIVLTGATGYLGSFILAELLLKYADSIIWCLTRSGGLTRILDALAHTRIEILPEQSGRVRALQADLSLPQLGLDEVDAAHISSADLIIHNGALVHWTRPYRALLGANVHSLLSLLALASPSARLIFVSGGGQTALDEGNEQAFANANGYSATKYVAERLCSRAGQGVQVLRPGYIIGEPVCNADDFLWRLARVVVELGVYVRSRDGVASMNAAPVRYVARRVIEPHGTLDRIWVQCPINELWDALIAEGYQLRQVDDEEWEEQLEADLVKRGASHPLIALAPFAKGMSSGLGYPRPDELPEEQIESGVLQGCVNFLQETGVIPLPGGTWKHVEDRKIGRTGK